MPSLALLALLAKKQKKKCLFERKKEKEMEGLQIRPSRQLFFLQDIGERLTDESACMRVSASACACVLN